MPLTLVSKDRRVVLAEGASLGAGVTLRREGDAWLIEGPVRTGGSTLAPGRARLLRHGLDVEIAGERFACVEDDSVVDPKNTAELALQIVRHGAKVAAVLDAWSVIVLDGDGRGATRRVDREIMIGRGETVDLVLVEPSVSREHARVRIKQGELQIQDLGSTQGTFVGDARLDARRWAKWPRGSVVRVGDVGLACSPPTLLAIEERTEALPIEDAPPLEAPKVDEPKAVPVEGSGAPIANAPSAPPKQKAKRASALLPWLGAGLLLFATAAALVWIFRGG